MVFEMVFASRFVRCSVRNVDSCIINNVSFLSYFLSLTPCVIGFAEVPASYIVLSTWLLCWYSF